MRRDAQQDLTLAHVAADEAEVEELEIAQAAVDQARRSGGRARREIGLVDDRDGEPAEGGVPCDPCPDDAAADDEEVDGAVDERPHRLVSFAYGFALLYLSI